jgi:general secretion pathway protein F
MRFRITGLNHASAEISLVMDAPNAAAARLSAAAAGVAALDVVAEAEGEGAPASGGPRRGAARFSLDLFCQELLAMLNAGVTLREVLETLSEKERQGGSGEVITGLLGAIHQGLPLSAAMAQRPAVFPPLLVESLRAAERTSDYGPALERFARYRSQGRELRAKLVGAALYPVILLAVSGAVLLFLVGYVVPRFAHVYADMGDRLPAASRVLMHIGLAIDAQPALVLGSLALALAGLMWAWRSGQVLRVGLQAARLVPRVREMLLTVQRARLYRTVALLLAGGLPAVPALALARGVLDGPLGARLDAAQERIRQGQPFSQSFAAEDLSTVVADRFFRVGESTGRLAEMIDRAADFHEEELSRSVDWLGRVMGPVMMLAIGGLIGVVVVLMYLPIFQLTDALQ